ncbi:ABC transporter ATP-binding protein [Candidatus Saccharibacteria bacterium CPR2]|nr:ABC transporter ATP-binding protein [Candidatus Saccharibacteria bacterium CPR2]
MGEDKGVMLRIENVAHSYHVGESMQEVLKGLSFDVPESSFVIIFGPSGSGKSTLLNILSGLLKPMEGKLMFRGTDLYSLNPEQVAGFRAKTLGRVYQTSYWVKSLKVVENVSLPLYFSGWSKRSAQEQAIKYLKQIGMDKYAHKYPTQLSGGEQQRVSMARGLVADPDFIVADEPTGNLDTMSSDMVMSTLQGCKAEFNKTIILVTHDLRYLPMGDIVYELQDGRLVNGGASVTQSPDKRNVAKRFSSLAQEKSAKQGAGQEK